MKAIRNFLLNLYVGVITTAAAIATAVVVSVMVKLSIVWYLVLSTLAFSVLFIILMNGNLKKRFGLK